MKILEKRDYHDWRFPFACSKCESKLEAEPDDVAAQYHEGWSDPRDNSGSPAHWTYHVQCPVCSKDQPVDANTISKLMQHTLQEKAQRRNTSYFDR